MIFRLMKSSDYWYEGTVEINTLEELLEFQDNSKCPIIISGDIIEVYDHYRE